MLTVELSNLVSRPRTWLLTGLVLVLPAFFLFGLRHGGAPLSGTRDPIAYLAAAQHGPSLVLAPLLFGSPVFLPLAVAMVGGAAIGATVVLPNHGPVAVGPSGTVAALSPAAFMARVAIAAGYVAGWLAALASIGVLAGLLTRSAVGGVSIAVGYHLLGAVLTQIEFLRPIHPALLAYWLGRWTTVAETHPGWSGVAAGALCCATYVMASTLVGLAVLHRRDIAD